MPLKLERYIRLVPQDPKPIFRAHLRRICVIIWVGFSLRGPVKPYKCADQNGGYSLSAPRSAP